MAVSESSVCNIALARIGNRNFIQALTESTTEAQVCAVLFADARNAVLEALAWPFATRRATLALLANVTRTGWANVYELPADYVAAQYLHTGERNPTNPPPFALEDDAASNLVLCTDQEEAELVYTYRAVQPARWSALFVEALAWKLAGDLALALSVKPQVGLAMLQGYKVALAEAKAAALNQGQRDAAPEASWIRERG